MSDQKPTSPTVAQAVALSAQVAECLTGSGVLAQAGALFLRRFGHGPACLIADETTWAAAGAATLAALNASGIATRCHILPAEPRPKPTLALAETLRGVLALDASTPVAVGSGVINDVVKHAAFALGRPYLCVATATSMDGYTSAGAPLVVDGFKKTIACQPARAVLGDLDVLAAAPRAMTGWGFGDMAGKVPAGADWIVADALGVEPMDPMVWPMVQGGLRGWLANPQAIAQGDRAAISGLFDGLTLVGLAMEAHGTSRPASGADHQIAHLWEMQDLRLNGARVSHGACVAVGCSAVLRMWDWLLTQDLQALDVAALVAGAADMDTKAARITAAFGPGEIAARCLLETRAKHPDCATLAARLTRLVQVWPDLRARLAAQLMPADQMRAALHLAEAPSDAADIGVTRAHLRDTILSARFLRSRYTILDLLDETGLLDRAAEAALPHD